MKSRGILATTILLIIIFLFLFGLSLLMAAYQDYVASMYIIRGPNVSFATVAKVFSVNVENLI